MNRLLSLLFLTFFIFSSAAVAANKVVVVPLGGAKHYMYWQGDWSVDTSYKIGDGVQHEGSSYVCVEAHPSTAPDAPPSVYWNLLALKGDPGGSHIVEVTSATQVWMDRNLGALRVATKSTDSDAYGSLYQWGRPGDGHEERTSLTDPNQYDNPTYGSFITGNSDWRVTPDDDLWSSESSANNPCPAGFRLPTAAEWETELASWGSNNNSAGALASPLKLVPAGYRNNNTQAGVVGDAGIDGNYWSSTVDGSSAFRLWFNSTDDAAMHSSVRAAGYTVRCLKD